MTHTVELCFEQDQNDLSVDIPDGIAEYTSGAQARVYFTVSNDFVIDPVAVTVVRCHR